MLDPDTVQPMIADTFQQFREAETIAGDDSGTIAIQGDRFNIMGAEYFMADIYHTLSEIYGEGAGGIIRETGEAYGTDLLAFVEETGPQETFGRFLGLLKFLGYSAPTVTADSISFPSSPTAVAYSDTDYEQRHTCYFLEGMLNSALQELFADEEIQVTEETCIADGADSCRFAITDGDDSDADTAT